MAKAAQPMASGMSCNLDLAIYLISPFISLADHSVTLTAVPVLLWYIICGTSGAIGSEQ